MKSIQLEVSNNIYQTIIDFLSLLPKEQCHLISGDELSDMELQHTLEVLKKLKSGDESNFDNWDDVKLIGNYGK